MSAQTSPNNPQATQQDLQAALRLLNAAVAAEPYNPSVWLALSEVVERPDQAEQCLHNVLRLDPDNLLAMRKLERLQKAFPHHTGQQPLPEPGQPVLLARTAPQAVQASIPGGSALQESHQSARLAAAAEHVKPRPEKSWVDTLLTAAIILAGVALLALIGWMFFIANVF
jgi:cytochrome c-type biogenesis protein CcmH/NrfG